MATMKNGQLVIRGAGDAMILAVNGQDTIASYTIHISNVGAGLTLPAALREIESEAFYGVRSLRSVSIPNSLTAIGAEAFCSCRKRESPLPHCPVTIYFPIFHTGGHSRPPVLIIWGFIIFMLIPGKKLSTSLWRRS